MDPFFGEIRPFAFTFAPVDWAFCTGQTMSIQQFQVLYAVIGTKFGGNGTTTFNVPDLQGRMPIHRDNVNYLVGQTGGAGTVTLDTNHSLAHTHALQAGNVNGTQQLPGGGVTPATASLLAIAATASGLANTRQKPMYADPTSLTPMSPTALSAFGGGAGGAASAHDNNQPSLVLNFCIATNGEWPERP
ncbi:MAG: tail fiber protein [Rhodospirillaceae bacterium]|nr:tail fiber protein [Rhodospirillales bacterium]